MAQVNAGLFQDGGSVVVDSGQLLRYQCHRTVHGICLFMIFFHIETNLIF